MQVVISELATSLMLGDLLNRVRQHWGSYELLDHWQQGEFHHDTVSPCGTTAALTTPSSRERSQRSSGPPPRSTGSTPVSCSYPTHGASYVRSTASGNAGAAGR